MNKIALLLASIATTTTSSSATRAAAATNLAAFVSSSSSSTLSFKLKNTNIHMSSVEQKQALLSCPTIPLRDGTPHPMM